MPSSRRLAPLAALIPLLLSGASGPITDTSPQRARECIVSYVYDGDTLVCTSRKRIRAIGIDAPEMDQEPYGPAARDTLRALAPRQTRLRIELDVQERDRYGRTLAYLWLPDGRMLNEVLAASGYAVAATYPPNVRYEARIRRAAASAREGRAGLWRTPAFSCPPSAHRSRRC